jgi:hypothetical protein
MWSAQFLEVAQASHRFTQTHARRLTNISRSRRATRQGRRHPLHPAPVTNRVTCSGPTREHQPLGLRPPRAVTGPTSFTWTEIAPAVELRRLFPWRPQTMARPEHVCTPSPGGSRCASNPILRPGYSHFEVGPRFRSPGFRRAIWSRLTVEVINWNRDMLGKKQVNVRCRLASRMPRRFNVGNSQWVQVRFSGGRAQWSVTDGREHCVYPDSAEIQGICLPTTMDAIVVHR